ncbi:MAG: penicillin acylase [Bacteroidetes bacterium]|nr:penicillin acylase [Bacteroidota bacterium]
MKKLLVLGWMILVLMGRLQACSIVYYIDSATGKIYVANNEDYFLNVKPYIRIEPAGQNSYARLWYGWKDFAQGGINAEGLFFDGATTPDEPEVPGYHKPKGNLGDEILAQCKNVEEAVAYLEKKKVALTNGHLMFGDKYGHAVVVEWVDKEQKIISIKNGLLLAINFLLTDTGKGGYPCPRYSAMEAEAIRLKESSDSVGLKQVGNIAARAVQVPAKDAKGKDVGTLYSTFIDISDMKFKLVYKLDNRNITSLDLKQEFANNKGRTIELHGQ